VRDLKDLVDVAQRAAQRAASYLRGREPPAPAGWTEKGQHDFVSEADRAAEALIAEMLTREVAGSTVVGEELSPGGPGGGEGAGGARSGEVVWIVDPLDGTTNFLHGYPQYAVSIGCVVRCALCVGVVHDVPRDLVYWGASGLGAWQRDRRLRVSGRTEPRHALVGTGFPWKQLPALGQYLDQLAAVVASASGVRRAGSAALDLTDVAAGRLDAFWELTLAPWDVAAGVVLVREAGGVVTTLDGSVDVLYHGPIVAGNPVLHGWLLELLRNT
jgi:myo-inositol-1(or 4)-monophosphatase